MTRAPRPRHVGLAVAVLVSLLGLTTVATTTAGARPAATGDTTFLLQSQSGWVAPTGMFRINISVPPLPPGAELQARLYTRVTTQAQLDRTGRGESLTSLQSAQVTVPLDTAPIVGNALDLSFPVVASGTPPPYGFLISREGVYPLAITVVDADGNEIGQLFTHLVRLPDAGSGSGSNADKTPLTVALVVPVSAPVAHKPDGNAVFDADQKRALEQLITTLGQSPGVRLTLQPTPETVSALAEGDNSNNTKVVASLAAASRNRQVLSGPWVGVDSGAWVDQGLTDAFGRELALGAASLTDLLSLTPDTATTVIDATTSSNALSTLVTAGVRQAVVPSDRLESTSRSSDDEGPLTQTFDLTSSNDDRVRSVAADDDLSTRLVTGDDRVLAAHEVVASLSLLALLPASGSCVLAADADQCSRGLALQLPASAAEAQIPLSVLLDAFADRTGGGPTGLGDGQAIVSPMTVDSLIKVVDPASESGRTRPDIPVQQRELTSVSSPSLGTYPARLRATLTRVDGFRSMVTVQAPTGPPADPATLPVTAGLELADSLDQVALSSGSAAFDEQTRQDYLDGANARIDDQLSQITTEEQTVVTLTSRNGKIPLTINNGLDYPVEVRIVLESDKLDFPNGAVMDRVLLPPRVPTRVDVPVQARASGAFKLEATITSPDDGLRITSGRFNVRSTAVSGVGLVLTITAGLFLLLWWGRHFRRTRRDKRLIASDHPSTRTAPADAPAATGTTNGNGSGSPPGAISYAPADRD